MKKHICQLCGAATGKSFELRHIRKHWWNPHLKTSKLRQNSRLQVENWGHGGRLKMRTLKIAILLWEIRGIFEQSQAGLAGMLRSCAFGILIPYPRGFFGTMWVKEIRTRTRENRPLLSSHTFKEFHPDRTTSRPLRASFLTVQKTLRSLIVLVVQYLGTSRGK